MREACSPKIFTKWFIFLYIYISKSGTYSFLKTDIYAQTLNKNVSVGTKILIEN